MGSIYYHVLRKRSDDVIDMFWLQLQMIRRICCSEARSSVLQQVSDIGLLLNKACGFKQNTNSYNGMHVLYTKMNNGNAGECMSLVRRPVIRGVNVLGLACSEKSPNRRLPILLYTNISSSLPFLLWILSRFTVYHRQRSNREQHGLFTTFPD